MRGSVDFSIIIPTCNRPSQLAACLAAISEIDYPRERFEVVVVDDGGEGSLEPVVGGYQPGLQVTFLKQSHGGPAQARNRGAAAARGRVFAFTDDDCAPAPDWLVRLAAQLDAGPNLVVGGRTVNALTDNVYSEASQLLIDYLYLYFGDGSNALAFFASCNFALPAPVYRSVGGFDPSFPQAAAEDRDICDRLQLQGYTMVYAADAVVHHSHPLALFSFWWRHFSYGRGARRFRRAHSQRSGKGIRVEPLQFYTGMFRYPFRRDGIRRPLSVSALLIASQVANFSGFIWEWVFPQKTDVKT